MTSSQPERGRPKSANIESLKRSLYRENSSREKNKLTIPILVAALRKEYADVLRELKHDEQSPISSYAAPDSV
jgi:hypothetical protein